MPLSHQQKAQRIYSASFVSPPPSKADRISSYISRVFGSRASRFCSTTENLQLVTCNQSREHIFSNEDCNAFLHLVDRQAQLLQHLLGLIDNLGVEVLAEQRLHLVEVVRHGVLWDGSDRLGCIAMS